MMNQIETRQAMARLAVILAILVASAAVLSGIARGLEGFVAALVSGTLTSLVCMPIFGWLVSGARARAKRIVARGTSKET